MIRLPDPKDLAHVLKTRFGIAFSAEHGENPDGAYFDFRPEDLHDNEGFLVRTTIGWRSIRSRLQIGRFGADLLCEMAKSSVSQRFIFVCMARSLADAGGKIQLRINGVSADPLLPKKWTKDWTSLELGVERTPVMVDHNNECDIQEAVLFWGAGILGMVVALLPVEEIEQVNAGPLEGLPEGAAQRVEVNRYERSRLNRALCISVQGTRCKVCGLRLEERYGGLGRDFIHVHHVVPVSKLGPDYLIDPTKDLVPVCPNCHAMLHRREPPYSVDELRQLINQLLG